MIKVEKIEVWGFEHSVRGLRNPMNSWARSDSSFEKCIKIGENDLALMRKLYAAGQPHRKYLRQIFVSMDITAPLYWWKEFDTYKVGTIANSCSTMHKIHTKEFTIDDFSHEHLTGETAGLWANADGRDYMCSAWDFCQITCDVLNHYREKYLETKDKKYWWQMIQLLPSSYNQRRTVSMTYENVMNMLDYREGHKLDEWREFCKILKQLPYVNEIRDNRI